MRCLAFLAVFLSSPLSAYNPVANFQHSSPLRGYQDCASSAPEGFSSPISDLVQSPMLYRAQDAGNAGEAKRLKEAARAAAKEKAALDKRQKDAERKAAKEQAALDKQQSAGNLQTIAAGKSAGPAKAPKTAEPRVLTPLGQDVFPAQTFSPYKPSPSDSGLIFEVRTYLEPVQAPFKVSLIGVNINSWLENPDTYQTLADAAGQFPLGSILDNLAQNNPSLSFNDPALVARLLQTDIYAPYLKGLSRSPKLPPLFAESKGIVAYTRNYHIYGAAAGGLPYFGAPTEGADRRINLASQKNQIREYAVRLPDTDIFLVATINITPNWLEEGWDVRQVNRQTAEILVYAFNRKGKLIGGAGVSQNFLSKGRFITASQKMFSKYWQPSVPRVFFLWPSFKIINTPLPGTEKQAPVGVLPSSSLPYLNSTQKYILSSIENLRANNEKPEKVLFDPSGRRTYTKVKPSAPLSEVRPFLARRKLFLTGAPAEEKPNLHYLPRMLAELDGSAPRRAFSPIKITEPAPKAPLQAQEKAPKTEKLSPEQADLKKQQQEAELTAAKEQAAIDKQQKDAERKAAKEQAAIDKQQKDAERKAAKEQAAIDKQQKDAERKAAKEKASLEKQQKESPKAFLTRPIQLPLLFRAQNAGGTADEAKRLKDAERTAAKERSSLDKQQKDTERKAAKEQAAIDKQQKDAELAAAKEQAALDKQQRNSKKAGGLEVNEDLRQERRSLKEQKERLAVNQGILRRKYFPSNEKDKLKDLIGLLPKGLKEAPSFSTNNLLAVTNGIPAYELETDPAVYRSERKKYFSVLTSIGLFRKQFVKESSALKKALSARLDDELFWAELHKRTLQGNQLWTPELDKSYTAYKDQLKIRRKFELLRFHYDRDEEFLSLLDTQVLAYGKRELDYAQKNVKKPESMPRVVQKNQANIAKALARHSKKFQKPSYLKAKAKFQTEYTASAQGFTSAYADYKKIIPENLQVSFLNTAQDPVQMIREHKAEWTVLAERNRVPLEVIAFVEVNYYMYPTKRFRSGMERKALRQYNRDMRFLNYEGFILGLSSGWGIKTSLADRIDHL